MFNTELRFRQFRQYPLKHTHKASFFEKLRQFYKAETFEIIPIVSTESNVGFKVLNRIMEDFNLETIPDYPKPKENYSLKQELDRFLLKIRNDIAHGNNPITVKREDLERAIILVEMLMDLVYERIRKGFLVDKSFQLCEDLST